jgi:hypothetical protein
MDDIIDLASDSLEKKSNTKELERLIYKIGQCIDYQSLYALEESFNRCGLTIQTTSRNRMILCKLRDGRPVSESVVDDYIFIGGIEDMSREISNRASEKISDFVRTNAGAAGKVQNMARVWRNGLRMYDSVSIVNEDQQRIAGDLICE